MVEATAEKKAVKKAAPKASSDATYAVIMTGGKQFGVKVGDRVKIEKLSDDAKEGDKITFKEVLLTVGSDVTVGTPNVSGAEVVATLTKIGRYKTVDVIKYKQKSRYFKKYGHRQPYFEVTIDSIK